MRQHLLDCMSCRVTLRDAERLRDVSRTLGSAKLIDRDLERINRCQEHTLPLLRTMLESTARADSSIDSQDLSR